MSLWFVTPAWRRYALSAVCFDQRRAVIEALAAAGLEANCVVVADDENLDLARARGFHVVERSNEWLGRKFNDGMEYAGRQGAEWIVPIGSDSWVHPRYLLPPPEPGRTRTSAIYCVVERRRMAELRVTDAKRAGPYMIHRERFASSGFRPAADRISHAVDQSTVRGLDGVAWEQRDELRLQYVGFRGEPHMTSYDRLVRSYGIREHRDPAAVLSRLYPPELVRRALAAL